MTKRIDGRMLDSASIANLSILANISGAEAPPAGHTITAILDAVLGNTRGALVTRNATGWVKLDPGANGSFLRASGPGADLVFASIPGGGDMLSTNNLSDVANAATARANLGVAIGSNVQAYNANLTTWAGKGAPAGVVVGTTDVQTLSNKTISLASGSAGAPSLSFSGAGLFAPGGNIGSLTAGGIESFRWAQNSVGRANVFGAMYTVQPAVNGMSFKGNATSGTFAFLDFADSALAHCGSINVDQGGHTTSYGTSSDERAKPNRELLAPEQAIEVVNALRIWDFDKDGNHIRGVGVLAQEAYEILPRMVMKGDDDPTLMPTDEGYRGWSAEKAYPVPYMIVALQDALRRIADLEDRLNAVKK